MPMKEPRFARIIRRIIMTVALLVLALMGASYWLLNTGSGARFVLSYALPKVQTLLPEHLHITLRGVHGKAISDMRIRILTLSDDKGPWLYARNLTLRWNPMALWQGGLEINTLTADKLQFLRPPLIEETPPLALKEAVQNGIETITTLPKQLDKLSLPPLIVDELAIHSLEVSAAVLPQASFYTLSAQANLWHKPEQFSLSLNSVQGIASKGLLQFENTNGIPRFDLMWEEDAQGLLARFLPLKNRDKGISIRSAQTTKEDVLQFSLSAMQDKAELLELELRVQEQKRIELFAQLPAPDAFEGMEKGTAPILAQSTVTRDHVHVTFHNTLFKLDDSVYKDSLAEMDIHIRDKDKPYLLETTLRSRLPSGTVASAYLRSEGDGGEWQINGLNAALGADTTLALGGDVSLTAETASLQGRVNTPDISADVELQASDFFGTWAVESVVNVTSLGIALPQPFTPMLTLPLSLQASGARSDSVRFTLEGQHIAGSGEIFTDTGEGDLPLAKITLASRDMENSYHLTAEHRTTQHGTALFRFNEGVAEVAYQVKDDRVDVPSLSLKSGGDVEVKGNLSYLTAQGTATGNINGYLRGFSSLAPLGVPALPLSMLKGDMRVQFAPTRQGQSITARFESGKTALSGEALMDNLTLNADVLLPKGKEPTLNSRLEIQGLQQFLPLEAAGAEAKGTLSSLAFSLNGKDSVAPTALSGKGTFADGVVTLSALSLQHAKHDYRLHSPLKVEMGENTIAIPKIDFAIDKKGSLTGNVHLGAETVKGNVTLKDLPLNAIPAGGFNSLHGNLDGKATLSGKAASPVAEVTLTVEELQQNYPSLTRIREHPLSGTLTARIAGGTLKAGFNAAVPSENSTVKTDFTMPFALSLAPSAFNATMGNTFNASLDADVVLGPFLPLFLPDGVYGTGHLVTRLKASGAFNSPTITGDVNLHSGHFELLQTVSTIKNLTFKAKANGKEITITEGSATDGADGRIAFKGKLNLTPVLPMDVSAEVHKFVIMRHNTATATVSGATTLKGSLKDAALKGDWQIETARIAINPGQSNAIPDLRVVEVSSLNDPLESPDFAAKSEAEKARLLEERRANRPFSRNLKLSVGIEAKNQIFLEGFGLNAELKGKVNISGTAARPKIGGDMETIRGRWEFFGKIFNITRGRASLSENNLTAPLIDIEAQANANDVVAVASIKGTTDKPEITFTSIPSLPQDEILSRVMFGQNLNNISPYQAIQLADMVRTLKGGNSINPLTQLQHSLGIDQLRINNNGDAPEDVTVGVGKYLTDGVYLEVEGGAGEKAGKVSVEVDLTPRISVETEARQNADTAIRLNYKYDY